MKTTPKFMKRFFAPQFGNTIDRSKRGRGNRAARRAIATKRGLEHIEFADEPIYTERPEILNRGHLLLLVDKFPHMRERINQEF